jgi:hypothetical protein
LPAFVKLLLALFISVLIFAGFYYLMNTKLSDFMESQYSISEQMMLLLKGAVFLIIFLVLFFLFNLKPNRVTKKLRDIDKFEETAVLGEIKEFMETGEVKTVKDVEEADKIETDEPRHRGLLWRASKFAVNKSAPAASRGLLSLAMKIASKNSAPAGKGLLALAEEVKKSAYDQGKGLLAHASEFKKSVYVQGL